MSKESFKEFVKKNPNLIDYVRNNNTSWQELYEVYDLYGEEMETWKKYLEPNKEEKKGSNFNDLLDMAKNIDVDKVQNGVTSLQKALSLFSELFVTKEGTTTQNTYKPRAIYKKFED